MACSTLVIELVLTRAYSMIFFHHLSIVAVSMAMLGLAAGAVVLSIRPELNSPDRLLRSTARCSAAFAVTVVISYLLQIRIPDAFQGGWWGLLCTLLFLAFASVPFIFSGLAIAMLLTQRSGLTNKLYAGDLCGAALGCLLTPALLSWTDPSTAIFCAAAGAALSAYVLEPRRSYVALALILGVISGVSGVRGGVTFPYVKGRPDIQAETVAWNCFSRVTVSSEGSMPSWLTFYQGPQGQSKNIRIDVNTGTDILASDGDFSKLKFLGYDITSMVYYLRPKARVLILGSGGGRDVATALHFGNTDVTGVEMNELIVNLLKGKYLDYSGRLAEKCRMLWAEARAFLRDDRGTYDIIQMSMPDTSAAAASGAYLLTEHTLQTVEAWTDILRHLSPRGIFTVTRKRYFGYPAEVNRTLAIAIEALHAIGVEDPRLHIATLEGYCAPSDKPNAPRALTCLFVSRTPWTPEDLAALRGLEKYGFQEGDAARGQWEPDRAELIDPHTYRQALAGAPLDVEAPTDDRPFFFFYIDLGRLLRKDYAGLVYHPAVLILPQLLAGVSVMSGLLLAVPLMFRRRVPSAGFAVYFSCIGVAFMAIEVGLLQVLSIYLGHPLYSMIVVLFGLLLAAGLGSYLTGPLSRLRGWLLPLLCLLLGVVAWGYPGWLHTPGVSAAGRIAVSLLIVVPLGLFMGMAFPLGLEQLQRREPSSAAWCWALNGAASVVTSVLALVVALLFGLQKMFVFGLLAYALAAWVYRGLCRR